MTATRSSAVGSPTVRVDAVEKVTGEARYAAEQPLDRRAYGVLVQATIARGRITSINQPAAPGVLAVLTHEDAPKLGDPGDAELALLLQDDRVRYRGQIVALVVAETLEQARDGAGQVRVTYDEEPHDVVLRTDHPQLYTPETVNPNFPSETETGEVEPALDAAAVVVDNTYSTPAEHNNPMEPHAATAVWDGDRLTAYDSSQGAGSVKQSLLKLFDLDDSACRVLSAYVGGGFGSKGSARPPVVLAAMGARVVDRPVTVTATRQQMWAVTGYRTPTVQRVRLGADADGRLVALDHLAYSQTSRVLEFAEQTAVISRTLYATPNVRTSHRLLELDVPTPKWMRAPGEAPGSFALESAMDELAVAGGIDPVELRILNDADREPEGGLPFSSRHLVECLRTGAERFGWHERDRRPGVRRDGRWLIGTGVASSTYPARTQPSTAAVTARPDGTYLVEITAADIGTGARTVLTQIAADELHTGIEQVELRIADTDYGQAMIAGGSMGTASWSWPIVKACKELRERVLTAPAENVTVHADSADDVKAMESYARHGFGAQFAEVRVDVGTGEVRVDRMLGVFAAGRIINPTSARSQFLGGMTMGIGMALHEESLMDERFGDYVNHDLAQYHVPVNADIRDLDAIWLDETDEHTNPLQIKGIGEIGIVGAAAAVANAIYHATGVRQRHLPIRPDRVIQP